MSDIFFPQITQSFWLKNVIVELSDMRPSRAHRFVARVRSDNSEGPVYGEPLASERTLELAQAITMRYLIGKTDTITFVCTGTLSIDSGWYRKQVNTRGKILKIER